MTAAALIGTTLLGSYLLSGCGGGSTPVRSPPRPELNGLDVFIEPDIILTGEGVRQHPSFGDALVGAMESRLVGEGFDVVSPEQNATAVHIQVRANLEISRSQFLMVNGAPLESRSAQVQVRVLSADGALVDAFEVSGDPSDADTTALVATNLAERMKRSRRLLAIAKSPPQSPERRASGSEPLLPQQDRPTAERESARTTSVVSGLVPGAHMEEIVLDEDEDSAPVRAPAVRPKVAPAPQVAVPVSGKPQNDSFALVVGVEKYRDLPPPPGAASDAQRFRTVLRDTLNVPDRHIIFATDQHATRSDLEKHLRWLRKNVPEGGRIYFFFAGHGAPEPTKDTSYLVPYDGDPNDLDGSALSMKTLMLALSDTKAAEVLAFIDACFTGGGGASRSVMATGLRPLIVKRVLPVVSNVALFTASAADETSGASEGNGLFTQQVTDGLGSGRADLNGDGTVTLGELSKYVGPRVSRLANESNRKQTPTLTVPPRMDPEKVSVVWGLPAK